MILALKLLNALFIFISAHDRFKQDLKTLKERYVCEWKCVFNHSEINSKTITEWPKCYDVCGVFTLNANSDVSFSQLKSVFSQTRQLSGGFRIENTLFTNLSFFSFPSVPFNFFCDIFGTYISNNSKLENIDELYNVEQWINDYTLAECPFQLTDNPKLDASSLCESPYYKNLIGLEVFGNKKDCGCYGGSISQRGLGTYENCTNMYGGLNLSNITDSPDLLSLSKVKTVKGLVEIHSCDFQNLTFLKNLKTIKAKSDLMRKQSFLNIHDNPRLVRLGWDALTTVKNFETGLLFMNIENLHPDFCLTFDEIIMLMRISVRYKNLHATVCTDCIPMKNGTKVCIFQSMSSLDSGCTWIHGHLSIGSGDEEFVGKLRSVTGLFGSLTIQNTNLETVAFLKNLQSIALLEDSPVVISVLSNKQLSNFSLPNLMPILTRNLTSSIVIEDNAPNLFRSSRWCLFFQTQTRKNVYYNRGNCVKINEDREAEEERRLRSSSNISFCLALILISYSTLD